MAEHVSNPENTIATITTIAKNKAEELHIRLNEYRGSHFVDLRLFTPVKGADGLHPTKKGVALNISKIDELMGALALARSEAERLGLLKGGAA